MIFTTGTKLHLCDRRRGMGPFVSIFRGPVRRICGLELPAGTHYFDSLILQYMANTNDTRLSTACNEKGPISSVCPRGERGAPDRIHGQS